jgi:PAS domain S-box-containing protein
MKKEKKTRGQLISELAKLRQRIAELEKGEAEHKLKEQTLRESKELFEKTFVSQLDALFILDANNPPKILDCNPSTTRVFGHSRKEMLGRTTDFLHVDKRRRRKFQEHLHPAIAKQGFFHLPEFEMKRNDGTVFPTEHTVVSLEDDQGKRIGWVSLVRDISERKRAEEALRESEQRYSSLFKINHSVMLLIDPENADIVDGNPAACSFYGWSQEELTSMKITDINILSNEQVFTEMERAKSEKRQHFFFRHRLANEEIRDVEVYSGPIILHGKKLLYSIIHDITERRRTEEELQKSEERYRLLVETMNEGLAMADHNYVFTYVNERFCEMIGCSRDELTGHNLIEFVHDDYKESMKDQMGRRKMGEAKRFDLVWGAKDGHKVYTLVSPRGFFDAEGRFTGSLGVLTDITDRKQVEKALRKAHDRLERRTTELVKLNRKMKQEIEERKLAEQELRKREAQLEINTNELEEVNTALRVLLKRRDEDKTDLEEKILSNVKELVLPYVERLRKSGMDAKQSAYVSILESNLNDVVSPFIHKLSSKYVGLTPTEIQIANLVKEGKTTKEIAEILNSSSGTVEFHRKNIRKKIGIVNRKANLRSHLLSM